MAYLARIEPQDSQPVACPPPTGAARPKPDFSPLEWSVVRLARIDSLWTIRERRPAAPLVELGARPAATRSLANAKLEALRRMAVLTWHYGFTVPGEDVANFISAGFSPDQYELMAGSINAALSAPRRIAA